MLAGFTPWPPDVADRYRLAGYWSRELLGDLLDPWVHADGSRVALVSDAGIMTYAELHARVNALAAGLQRIGIKPRDRLVVQLPNGFAFVVVTLALFRLGALPVFALAAHRGHEIVQLSSHSGAVAYVTPGRYGGFDYQTIADEVRSSVPSLRHVISADGSGPHLGLS